MISANKKKSDHEVMLNKIISNISDANVGKIFGASCIKAINGKTAAIFWKNTMLFKLNEEDQKKALKLNGAKNGFHLYAPEKPMKGWIAIPDKHSNKWTYFAKKAVAFVKKQKK